MEKFKKTCTEIKNRLSPALQWETDARFNTALISFEKDAVDSILGTISNIFENQFDTKSIKKATKQEKKLAKFLFGLSEGQLLFTSNMDDLTLFGAWWPWGNDEKVSLRIGIFTLEDNPEEEDIQRQLAEWFGL